MFPFIRSYLPNLIKQTNKLFQNNNTKIHLVASKCKELFSLFSSLIEEVDKGNIVINQRFKDNLQNHIQFDHWMIVFAVNFSDISEKRFHSMQFISKPICYNLKKYMPLVDPIYEAFQVSDPKFRYNNNSLSLFRGTLLKKFA